jgi:hypothetical protein
MPLKDAARDARYLVNRGYSKESVVRFVSDHYRLLQEQRFVLTRVVVASGTATKRKEKMTPVEMLHGRVLFIDGYNVLISVESLLAGKQVYLCDDGFIRDTQGIFRSYRMSRLTKDALSAVFDLLACACLAKAEFFLDRQISMSGQLAAMVRQIMAEHRVPGTASTMQDVDRQLKECNGIVATGDGNVIDASSQAMDIPAEIARRLGLEPFIL